MNKVEKEEKSYTIERKFLAKITMEELIGNIVRLHAKTKVC